MLIQIVTSAWPLLNVAAEVYSSSQKDVQRRECVTCFWERLLEHMQRPVWSPPKDRKL